MPVMMILMESPVDFPHVPFVPFLLFFMKEKWNWDYLWALLCMVAAVYFVNRGKL